MKTMKKAMALFTAVATVAMSASAFAADLSASGEFTNNVKADYSEIAENKVTATVDTEYATTETQMSFVILDADADDSALEADDILYIDQKELTESDNSFTGVINVDRITDADGTTIPVGTYPVKLGYTNNLGEFVIAEALMVVSEEDPSQGTTITIIWGDVNCDDEFDAADAGTIFNKLIGGNSEFGGFVLGEDIGNGMLWGDVNCDDEFDAADAGTIFNKLIGGNSEFGGFVLGEEAEIEIPEN